MVVCQTLTALLYLTSLGLCRKCVFPLKLLASFIGCKIRPSSLTLGARQLVAKMEGVGVKSGFFGKVAAGQTRCEAARGEWKDQHGVTGT